MTCAKRHKANPAPATSLRYATKALNFPTTNTHTATMPGQILSPVPLSPGKAAARDQTSAGEFFKSLNATLSSTTSDLTSSPVRTISESDWDVPAPPPPSPVSFHKDHWQRSLRR